MSNHLLAFLRSYQQWLQAGAPPATPYYRDCGLCKNAGIHSNEALRAIHVRLREEFGAGGSTYPFSHSSGNYRLERDLTSMHLNPERVAWVATTIKELEAAENQDHD